MRVLAREEALQLLNGQPIDDFVARLVSELHLARGAYSTPVNSGGQLALARLFAYVLFRDSPVCLYVSGWSIAPSAENLDLFYGYRRTHGESRLLIDAPIHAFEPAEQDSFVSILSMVFYFSWDASVFDPTGRVLLQTSHDGWLEFRGSEAALITEVVSQLEAYRVPALGQKWASESGAAR